MSAGRSTSPTPAPPARTRPCAWYPPWCSALEQSLEFIADDELVEVTPKNIRLRKRILSKEQRAKRASKLKMESEE